MVVVHLTVAAALLYGLSLRFYHSAHVYTRINAEIMPEISAKHMVVYDVSSFSTTSKTREQ